MLNVLLRDWAPPTAVASVLQTHWYLETTYAWRLPSGQDRSTTAFEGCSFEAHRTLRPRLTPAASEMEAFNIEHSGSMSPLELPEKFHQRCKLKDSWNGVSPRRSLVTLTTQLGLPGLSRGLPAMKANSQFCFSLYPSVQDMRPQVTWYDNRTWRVNTKHGVCCG